MYTFIFGLLMLLYIYSENGCEYEYSKIYMYLFVIFLAGFAGLRGNIGSDYVNYMIIFDVARSFSDYKFIGVEPLSGAIPVVYKNLGWFSYTIVFLTFAAIGVSLKAKFIFKYSPQVLLSFLFYYSNSFFVHDCTQIRASVAAAIFLGIGLDYIFKRKLLRFVVCIIISGLFHYSAFLFLPIYFLNKEKINKRLYLTLLIIVYICAVSGVNKLLLNLPILSLVSNLNRYIIASQMGQNSPINLLSPFYTLNVITCILYILWSDKIRHYNNSAILLIKIQYMGLILLYGVSALNGDISRRCFELYSIVSIVTFTYFSYFIRPYIYARLISVFIAFIQFYMIFGMNQILQPYKMSF